MNPECQYQLNQINSCTAWIQENDKIDYDWLTNEDFPAFPCTVDQVTDTLDWGHTPYSGLTPKNYFVRKYHRGALGGCARSETVKVGNQPLGTAVFLYISRGRR